MGQAGFREVWDRSGHRLVSSGRSVETGLSGMCRGTLRKVRDELGYPWVVVHGSGVTRRGSGSFGGPFLGLRTSRGTHGEVRDRTAYSRGGTRRVEGLSGWSGTGRRTLWEVLNGSEDPQRRPSWVGGPLENSGTDRETLWVVRDGSGDTRGGHGRVGGPSETSGMGWGTHGEVRDVSREHPWGQGRVGEPPWGSGQVEGPSGWSGTSWVTLGEVWDGLGDPRGGRDGSRNPPGGSGQVKGPSGRYGTGRGPSGRSGMGRGSL